MNRLLRTKNIRELQEEAQADYGLRRALNVIDLIAIGVGAIIGAGIFVLTGQAAADYAGPAIVVSFILAGVACAFAGLCYAEFATMIPIAGSAYTYSYATLGEIFAWMIGWDLVIEYSIGSATVAVGWSGYAVAFLNQIGLQIPPTLIAPTGTHLVLLSDELIQALHIPIRAGWYPLLHYSSSLQQAGISPAGLPQAMALFNLPAAIIIGFITVLLVKGIKESAIVNSAIVLLKVGVIIVVIAAGFSFVNAHNWTPFIPPNSGRFGEFGWSGVARGAAVVFFAYIGFDAVSAAAQESRNPQRDMPIGILGSLILCTVLYILVALVITGIVHYSRLNVADPVALAMDATGRPWLAAAVKLGAIAGLTSVILVLLMAQARIIFTMARDGLLPDLFARIHPRFRTPANTSIIIGFLVALVASVVPIKVLGELVSIGTLAAFIVVCMAVLVLRYRHPHVPRPFKTPWVPLVPSLGIACCLYLALSLPIESWARLVVWLIVGLAVYSFYGSKHSRLGQRAQRVDSERKI
jgi:APA family basic amino acid/polyamine antiporter